MENEWLKFQPDVVVLGGTFTTDGTTGNAKTFWIDLNELAHRYNGRDSIYRFDSCKFISPIGLNCFDVTNSDITFVNQDMGRIFKISATRCLRKAG